MAEENFNDDPMYNILDLGSMRTALALDSESLQRAIEDLAENTIEEENLNKVIVEIERQIAEIEESNKKREMDEHSKKLSLIVHNRPKENPKVNFLPHSEHCFINKIFHDLQNYTSTKNIPRAVIEKLYDEVKKINFTNVKSFSAKTTDGAGFYFLKVNDAYKFLFFIFHEILEFSTSNLDNLKSNFYFSKQTEMSTLNKYI